MASVPQRFITPEQYLEIDRCAEGKSDYVGGEMFARAGDSLNHAVLKSALIAILHLQLCGKDCRISSGDLRIFVPETGLYAYPDATVFCGKPPFLNGSSDTL